MRKRRRLACYILLTVAPERTAEYEAALAKALPLIKASPGFENIALCRDAVIPGRYLLRVNWRSIADHQDGFRTSQRYQDWRALLHRFYETVPDVHYFEEPFLS